MNKFDKSENHIRSAFIVGCPRSGTTLLQAMLSTHPEVISLPETHFFDRLRSQDRVKHRLGISDKPDVENSLKQLQDRYLTFPVIEEKRMKSAFLYRHHIGLFRAVLDNYALQRGAEVWVEKTPNHLHYLYLIEKHFSQSLFIHVIRNGFDTIASLYKASNQYPESWGGVRTLDQSIFRWKHDVNYQKTFLKKPGHFFCRYEDIISDKNEAVLKMICDHLHISYDQHMVTDYTKSFNEIVNEEEHYKANVKRPLNARSSTSSIKLTADQEQYIREKIRDIDLDVFSQNSTAL